MNRAIPSHYLLLYSILTFFYLVVYKHFVFNTKRYQNISSRYRQLNIRQSQLLNKKHKAEKPMLGPFRLTDNKELSENEKNEYQSNVTILRTLKRSIQKVSYFFQIRDS